MTGITWAGGKLPRSNYELTLEGKRIEGSDFFCTTTFPVGDNYCSFVTGGWGGSVIGLSNVDHMDASENQTSHSREFKNDTWYQFRIRVTDEKIEAWIDKEQVVDQDRKDHTFGLRIECDPCRPLGIATYDTVGAVRNIRLKELKIRPDGHGQRNTVTAARNRPARSFAWRSRRSLAATLLTT